MICQLKKELLEIPLLFSNEIIYIYIYIWFLTDIF
jgi:hypothetical protein